MFARGTRQTGSSTTPPAGAAASPSSPRKRSKSPECCQLTPSPPAQYSAPASLSSSTSDLGAVTSYSTSPMTGVVTRSYEQMLRESQSLEERYHHAIVAYRNWQNAQSSSLTSSVSRLVLQNRSQLLCDQLMCGLVPLKRYCATNIQRKLIAESDPRRSALSKLMPDRAMCTLVAQSGSGVRSYCKLLCEELMIDLYVVGNMLYEPSMMKDLLREAEASGRALILFDQTTWFSGRDYDQRGVSFIQQLTARIASRAAEDSRRRMGGACASLSLHNTLEVQTLGNTIPGLWVIISTPTQDVHPTVVELSGGLLQLNEPSEQLALNTVRGALKKFVEAGFSEEDVEKTLSQTPYAMELQQISQLLKNHSIGNILRVIEHAYGDSCARSYYSDRHGQSVRELLPTALDVNHSMAQLSGQVLGGMQQASGTSAAAAAAAYGNGQHGHT